jgi:hypothetical protein
MFRKKKKILYLLGVILLCPAYGVVLLSIKINIREIEYNYNKHENVYQ